MTKCKRCVQSLQADLSKLKRKRSTNGAATKPRKDFEDESDDDGRYDIPEPGVMKVLSTVKWSQL